MNQFALDTSKKVWEALIFKDEIRLNNLIHESAVFIHMGATLTKTQEIDSLLNDKIIYKEVNIHDSTAINFDNSTLVLNTLTLVASVNNSIVQNKFVVSETYQKSENHEQLLSMAFTKIIY